MGAKLLLMNKKTLYFSLLGLVAGVLNGLFGAGGGVVVVPLLERAEIQPRKAHATSIAIIASLSIVSCIFYYFQGSLPFPQAFSYLPFGIIGAIVGAFLLKRMPNSLLKRLFGVVMIISAGRILLK